MSNETEQAIPEQDPEIGFKMKESEINKVLQHLAKQPYDQVAHLIGKIAFQVKSKKGENNAKQESR